MGVPAVFVNRRMPDRDERGSLIIALAVIFVLVLICSSIAVEVVGNQENVLAKYNSAATISAADAGLSDAVFRLDQMTPSSSSTSFCMDAAGVNCTQAPVSPSELANVSYLATPSNGGTTWSIQSKATVNGLKGAVQETVSYSAEYPFALFGNSGLDFNGSSSNGLGDYTDTSISSSSNPDTATADCSGGTTSSCVKVGSNGPIKCAGGLPANVTEVYYTGGGGAGNCSNPSPDPDKYNLTIPSAPTTGSPLTCPGKKTTDSSGDTVYELGSGYSGAPSSIGATGQSYTYYCNDAAVDISGDLSVLGTVQLYIVLDSTTDNTFINNGIETLYMAGGAEVNTTFSGTSGLPPSGTTLPVAKSLQILTNSTGSVGNANGGGANGPYTFGGVLYAPDANLVGNGCKSAYYGSLTINTLTCNGGPHLQVYYDNTLGTLYGPPSISGYSQVNPSTVSVP
jgi:Tfp pilus assembly protein PilX